MGAEQLKPERTQSGKASGCGDQDSGAVSWSMIAAKLMSAINRWAPVGYEDETGFHYGAEPLAEELS